MDDPTLMEPASCCWPPCEAFAGDINIRRVVFDGAARGTPADARLVPESGVVYGAYILFYVYSDVSNNLIYSGLKPSLYARGKYVYILWIAARTPSSCRAVRRIG